MKAEKPDLNALINQLEEIKLVILEKERSFPPVFFEKLHPKHQKSARNLIHYLGLRLFDLREIQEQLSTLGISSLSHSERYTLNINNILFLLYKLLGENNIKLKSTPGFTFNYPEGRKRLEENTTAIFGVSRRPGSRIMVTLPPQAAVDYTFVKDLVKSGMDVARINCSHEEEEVWKKMINHVKRASKALNTTCLIYMDLPGPRLRTGPVHPHFSENEPSNKKAPAIRLFVGDLLHVYKEPVAGKKAQKDKNGILINPANISMSLPEIWEDLQPGKTIHFNDGKLGGKIQKVTSEFLEVIITQAKPEKGSLLRGDKGINLPETTLKLPSLTALDKKILPFICRNADMLGYSFVRKPEDIQQLRNELVKIGGEDLPLILKIENRQAFCSLPGLLMECMHSPRYGIMLARGDLALEVGFTRIAEVQEQILWLCDAAHVPVIWATQVLENLVKKGLASRAEITDAAMSVRAECVMLNKGPFVREAIEMLANIDERMAKHMFKKHGALRPLHVAKDFFNRPEGN